MTGPLAWLDDAAQDRRRRGVARVLTARAPGVDPVLDLAGNDYLALTRHPEVVGAACAATRAYGAGSTGSRLVTGDVEVHHELEAALASHAGSAAALIFSSGYLANLGALTALTGPGALVVSDAANHASLVDACRLSRARLVVVPHGDVAAVRAALTTRTEQRAVVVTDAVFSVSGRLAPLAELHAVARESGALLMVDEAHGLGVVGPEGRGACWEAGLAGAPDVIVTVTLSKALGAQGGAVLGPAAVRTHLIDTARAFIFDTGLAPGSAAAARAALRLVDAPRVAALRRATAELASAVGVATADGAVVQVPVGAAGAAARARDACLVEGVRVGCFRPPSVPEGGSCLRLTGRADLTAEDIALAAKVVRAALAP